MLKELRAKAIVVGLFVASLPLLALLKAWQLATRQARNEDMEDLDTWAQGHPLTHPEPENFPDVADWKHRPLQFQCKEDALIGKIEPGGGVYFHGVKVARGPQVILPEGVHVVDDPVHGLSTQASRPLTPEERARVKRWWDETVNKRVGTAVFPARPQPRCKGGAGGGLTNVNPFTDAAVKIEPSPVPAIGFSMEPLGPELARMPLEHHVRTEDPRCKCQVPEPALVVDGFGYCKRCDLALYLDPCPVPGVEP